MCHFHRKGGMRQRQSFLNRSGWRYTGVRMALQWSCDTLRGAIVAKDWLIKTDGRNRVLWRSGDGEHLLLEDHIISYHDTEIASNWWTDCEAERAIARGLKGSSLQINSLVSALYYIVLTHSLAQLPELLHILCNAAFQIRTYWHSVKSLRSWKFWL
jgi:hypothetical protein